MYLVVVDAYSKWPELFLMSSSSTAARLRDLRMLFACAKQFTATEFQEFCKKREIEHICSPPFHLQSNGQAERFLDILKRILQKIKDAGTMEKLAEFLRRYPRTPSTSVLLNLSPAEVFLGRRMTTLLMLLKEPARTDGTRNNKMKEQFNRHHETQKKLCGFETIAWSRGMDFFSSKEEHWTSSVRCADEGQPSMEKSANQLRGYAMNCVLCKENDYSGLPFPKKCRRNYNTGSEEDQRRRRNHEGSSTLSNRAAADDVNTTHATAPAQTTARQPKGGDLQQASVLEWRCWCRRDRT